MYSYTSSYYPLWITAPPPPPSNKQATIIKDVTTCTRLFFAHSLHLLKRLKNALPRYDVHVYEVKMAECLQFANLELGFSLNVLLIEKQFRLN